MKRKRVFERLYSAHHRTLVCQDCGQNLESGESPSSCLCPNCGGKRMNIKIFPTRKDEEGPRKSVFENHDTEVEAKLKTFSGKFLSNEEFEKEFSDNTEMLLQKSYATPTEDGVVIRHDAYGIEKTFSKLIISVTKTLELDPSIMSGVRPIGDAVKSLPISEKGIMVLKKAHNLPEEMEGEREKEDWIEDSGIDNDLREEFGGDTMSLEEFINLMHKRYPDAPKNIYESLEKKGAISLDGTKVNINR